MVHNPFNIILATHILGGTVALIIAPLAMVTIKGGRWHRLWGKIYFWAMAEVALTAAVMCWLRSGLFLFLIAILSFYLALTGYRALRRKRPADKPQLLDQCLPAILVLAGGGFILSGMSSGDESGRRVRIIFGVISTLLGLRDLFRVFKPAQVRNGWMLDHMTRFLGAYIATVTAFSVVNFQFIPYFWRWLWPTVFGVCGIIFWRRYYVRKFNREAVARVPVANPVEM